MKTKDQILTKGIIVSYTVNKHHDVDGLTIDQGGKPMNVKFPPHTARFVQEVAGIGDPVQLQIHEKPHPPHHLHDDKHHPPKLRLTAIEHAKTGAQFEIDSVKPPEPPETGKLERFDIIQPVYTRGGKKNGITGLVFEGKFFHLHPDEYEEGEEGFATAKALLIKAKRRTERSGFVNEQKHAVYHIHEIEIDPAPNK